MTSIFFLLYYIFASTTNIYCNCISVERGGAQVS